MFEYIKRILTAKETGNNGNKKNTTKLSSSLDDNLNYYRVLFKDTNDMVIREFYIGSSGNLHGAVIYIGGLADARVVEDEVLRPLIDGYSSLEKISRGDGMEQIRMERIWAGKVEKSDELEKLTTAVLSGMTLLFVDHSSDGLIIATPGWEKRAITEPMSEKTVRGPREGFVETLSTNMALIRRRIKDPRLKFREYQLGTLSKTRVVMAYIQGIATDELINEVDKRMSNIQIDMVDDVATIEAFIEDNPYSPFPQLLPTERSDKVAANLAEGRVAIFCDGTPFAMIAPAVMSMMYQSPEDYYERSMYGTAVRFMRLVAFFVATTLPSLYIAMVSFHNQLIPARLVLTLAMGRILVPFPAFLEALLMELTIELLREASTRLPGPLGQTIGVVGGLVLGQAAVTARLVSPAMVIIVSLTAMATFTVPIYSASYPVRLLRFPLMFLASIFGVFGIFIGWTFLLIHLCDLKSFGTPYLSPIAPFKLSDLKDTIFRFPVWAMKKRPQIPGTEDDVREKDGEGGRESE